MKFMKKEYLQRKTREQGQVSWVLGLFLILFLAILLCMQLQVALYRESAMYMEDALALSNLASAVIDIEEYGITQKVLITDPEQAYERYCHALRENLGLDNHFMAQNRRMISGQVEIQNYTIYNVTSDLVEIWQRDRDGTVSVWSGNVGNVHALNGQMIEETGVYSEIAYPVEGFLGTRVMAHKGKLVDVIRNDNREKENEITENKVTGNE